MIEYKSYHKQILRKHLIYKNGNYDGKLFDFDLYKEYKNGKFVRDISIDGTVLNTNIPKSFMLINEIIYA